MKPLHHANISAKKYGGVPEDYLELHDFFDSSKATIADVRHRAILHNAFGIFLLEKVFGTFITNSDGKRVNVRDIGEDHVIDDFGFIPTVETWVRNMSIQPWMGGAKKRTRTKVGTQKFFDSPQQGDPVYVD